MGAFYWPGHAEDVKKWCNTCEMCEQRRHPAPRETAPLVGVHIGYPMQRVATDILGPLPEMLSGSSYVLVVANYFTQQVEAFPILNQEATTVARKLVNVATIPLQSSSTRTKAISLSHYPHQKFADHWEYIKRVQRPITLSHMGWWRGGTEHSYTQPIYMCERPSRMLCKTNLHGL